MSSLDVDTDIHAGIIPVHSEKFKDRGYESCSHSH